MFVASYKKRAMNLLVCVMTFVALLALTETFLSLTTHLKESEQKLWVTLEGQPAHCYTSDKHRYFPLIVHDPENNRMLHCLSYDIPKRQKGASLERNTQFALVGDSFVFGEGVKEEDTLAYLLNEKFSETNFRNYGKSGANVLDVYDDLSQILKKGNPKGIVYFYNLNDVLMSKEIESRQKNIIDFQNIRWSNFKKESHFFARILAKSTLYTWLERSLILKKETQATLQNYLDMYFDAQNKRELEQTLHLFKSMDNLAQQHHVKFSLVIYPLLYKDIFGRYPFKPIHELLMSFCEQNSLTCLNASTAFNAYRSVKKFTVHPIDYHPNRAANKRVVDYLTSTRSDIFRPK